MEPAKCSNCGKPAEMLPGLLGTKPFCKPCGVADTQTRRKENQKGCRQSCGLILLVFGIFGVFSGFILFDRMDFGTLAVILVLLALGAIGLKLIRS